MMPVARLLAALAGLALVCMAMPGFPARAAAPFDPFAEARIDERPGARVPLDGALRDQDGRATTLRKLGRGRPIVLVPVLHQCPNICGVTLAGVAQAARGLHALRPGRDFALVAFGIDPEETPQSARDDLARLARQTGDGGLPVTATVGAGAQVHAVTDALGYRYAFDPRIGQYAHAAATAVLTPDGRLVRWLYGLSPQSDALDRALADARSGHTGDFVRQLILLCYHYDPETGAYSLAIERVVRWAGIATVVLIAALILWLRRPRGRRERPGRP